jgi:hypothetical protein
VNTLIPVALRNVALLSALSATAVANPPVVLYPETAPAMVASLQACAIAASQGTQAAHLSVVRFVERVGRGNYEYWINASDPVQVKAYCRTEHNQIAQFQRLDGQWTGTHPARPAPIQQITSSAAACAQLCRADAVAPTQLGAVLRNDPGSD